MNENTFSSNDLSSLMNGKKGITAVNMNYSKCNSSHAIMFILRSVIVCSASTSVVIMYFQQNSTMNILLVVLRKLDGKWFLVRLWSCQRKILFKLLIFVNLSQTNRKLNILMHWLLCRFNVNCTHFELTFISQ